MVLGTQIITHSIIARTHIYHENRVCPVFLWICHEVHEVLLLELVIIIARLFGHSLKFLATEDIFHSVTHNKTHSNPRHVSTQKRAPVRSPESTLGEKQKRKFAASEFLALRFPPMNHTHTPLSCALNAFIV